MDSIIHSNDLETIIEYLKNKNIINEEAPFCLKCEKPLKWKKRSGSGDVFTWRCSTSDSTVSMRRKSLLEEFKIPIAKIIKLIHAFAYEESKEDTCLKLDISKPTVIKFFRRLREIICFECDLENMRLGGLGEVVEVDESKFMKTKHNRGKDLKRKLVIICF
jgi:hypothetical protein